MYDTKIGRWISEDPIGFQAADANLYRYVGNSPTNLLDPSGLAASDRAAPGLHEGLTAGDHGVWISYTRDGFVKAWNNDHRIFRVKQWEQLEVWGSYDRPSTYMGRPCTEPTNFELWRGTNVEIPGSTPHGHTHEVEVIANPHLQPDNGEHPIDGFAAGLYAPYPKGSTDTMEYWDNPKAPAEVYEQAQKAVEEQWKKMVQKDPKKYAGAELVLKRT